MTTYIALLSQNRGCDYTIDCGKKWTELEVDNTSDAIIELWTRIIGKRDDDYAVGFDGSYWNEAELSEVILLKVSEKTKIPVSEWYAKARQSVADDRKQEAEEKERADYERLKAKFNQTPA